MGLNQSFLFRENDCSYIFRILRSVVYEFQLAIKYVKRNSWVVGKNDIINSDADLLVLQDAFVAEGEGEVVMKNFLIHLIILSQIPQITQIYLRQAKS